MPKFNRLFCFAFIFLLSIFTVNVDVSAEKLYLPGSTSSQYLPSLKIFSYNLSYDGSLIAQGFGSGTLITNDGVILTNNHIVENLYDSDETFDAFQICLTKSSEPENPVCEYTASLIARDKDKDLALLKMDSKSVSGKNISFNFYLPYNSGGSTDIGESVTVIGYPDTGGKTVTYTSGLISGVINQNGIDFIKTDADISFGNSGGTALDSKGNFVGVPTYIVGSYSSETLGYLFPVKDAVNFINSNKNKSGLINKNASEILKSGILKNVNANAKGIYQNDYPPYSISLIDGWKFGNSLEGSFESENFYYNMLDSAETITISPETKGSNLSIAVSVEKFPYNLTVSDLRALFQESLNKNAAYTEMKTSVEELKFKGVFDALKINSEEYNWYNAAYMNRVAYIIPYGDYALALIYTYSDEEAERVSEMEEILETFTLDMGKVKSSVVNQLVLRDPFISIVNPFSDVYLSDVSYVADGLNYFGANFGKKSDLDFSVSIYYNKFEDEKYQGNFPLFKTEKLAEMKQLYTIVAEGDLSLDGHQGFYYIEQYSSANADVVYYVDIFVPYGNEGYVSVYYSGEKDSYGKNLSEFKAILNALKLSKFGAGVYEFPSFDLDGEEVSTVLSDIEHYVYEANIRSLNDSDVFAEDVLSEFKPGDPVKRKDFVIWAIKAGSASLKNEFEEFKNGEKIKSFVDLNYESDDSWYFEFAKKKAAVGGINKNGKLYFMSEDELSVAAALKIIFALYDYDVWQAPSYLPWYMPYLQLGYKENLIPYGVDGVNYPISRGEAAFMIDQGVLNSYYNNYWE